MSGALGSWRRGGCSAPRRKPIFARSFRLLLLSEVIFDGYEDYHYSDEPYEGDFYRDSYEEYYDDVLPSEWEERYLNGDLDELDQELS